MAKRAKTFDKVCAVYNRVSTTGQNPHTAMADLRAAAKHRGYSVGLAVAETGSGARNDRPGLQRVLDAARRGKVSAVLVSRLDRFGRSAADLATNIRALTAGGVEFVAVEQGLHVRTNGDATSQLLLTVLSGVAEFERDIIRARVVEGQRRARAAGRHIGRPQAEGPDAAAVRKLRARGRSWAEVATRLGCTTSMARRRYQQSSV